MYKEDEKRAFARRLRRALDLAPRPIRGATDLALQFNLRYSAGPVSKQTAHKWLSGQTIPTVDKINVLAGWMGVSAHWLRFGSPGGTDSPVLVAEDPGATTSSPHTVIEAQDVADMILRLPVHQRHLILALVRQLLGSPSPHRSLRPASHARSAP